MDPQLNCLVPFTGLFGLADATPDRRQTHYPHSSKTSRGFAQSGFNEVCRAAVWQHQRCARRPHRTLQIPPLRNKTIHSLSPVMKYPILRRVMAALSQRQITSKYSDLHFTKRAPQPLALFQVLGDVAHDRRDRLQVTVLAAQRNDGKLDRDLRAVLPDCWHGQ